MDDLAGRRRGAVRARRAVAARNSLDARASLDASRELTAAGPRPDRLLRSELLRGREGRWHVQALWRDREAVLAARGSGTQPVAILLAERLGAEHSHDVLTLEETLDR